MYVQYHGYVLLSACGGTLAARIDLLLFVFCGPKAGARFWTQKWGITKIGSPASKFVAPILGPWYMRFAFCKGCVELRQVASFIQRFLAFGAKMLVSHAG
jgi:hypothetical protein